ncbi:NAD(P)-dependent oxidoreductase [Corynebacterium sp.]|jgi:putative NADH-flavin reductase|uniref:NAD(P)-dependent oxidoreductase n=1 Tax=Corynebacterium sp. TaxID=1720 RepID=UPI0025BD85C1|nr:NAD(P)H-binding protein [Corynebacterium sp.]
MSTITVYGSTGMVGSAITAEAASRGFTVTGVTRKSPTDVKDAVAGVTYATGEVTDAADVVAKATATDNLVISVPGARDGSSVQPIIDAHAALIPALAEAKVTARIFIVGGAGATETPDGTLLKDTPDFPAAYKAEADSFAEILGLWRTAPESLDWTMLAPAPEIAPGEASASYTLGDDQPAGDFVSAGTFAKAAVDELEAPAHRRVRFTVANA